MNNSDRAARAGEAVLMATDDNDNQTRLGDILTDLPLHIECKNQERITFWKFWAQASEQCPLGQDPVLVISANNRPIVAVVDIDFLLNLLKTEKDYLSEVSGEW